MAPARRRICLRAEPGDEEVEVVELRDEPPVEAVQEAVEGRRGVPTVAAEILGRRGGVKRPPADAGDLAGERCSLFRFADDMGSVNQSKADSTLAQILSLN
jgi:hypothetical protein